MYRCVLLMLLCLVLVLVSYHFIYRCQRFVGLFPHFVSKSIGAEVVRSIIKHYKIFGCTYNYSMAILNFPTFDSKFSCATFMHVTFVLCVSTLIFFLVLDFPSKLCRKGNKDIK